MTSNDAHYDDYDEPNRWGATHEQARELFVALSPLPILAATAQCVAQIKLNAHHHHHHHHHIFNYCSMLAECSPVVSGSTL